MKVDVEGAEAALLPPLVAWLGGAAAARKPPLFVELHADFWASNDAHLRGAHMLLTGGCTSLTDGALVHLHDLHTLGARSCTPPPTTGTNFPHLCSVHVLLVRDRIGLPMNTPLRGSAGGRVLFLQNKKHKNTKK